MPLMLCNYSLCKIFFFLIEKKFPLVPDYKILGPKFCLKQAKSVHR